MIGNPKVSVIIPVYNTELYLPKCLDSVINQTLNEIEIIAINDGSTDNSVEILNDYALNDSRIRIISSQNKGGGAARNIGLSIATGNYIIFLDSDDFFELDMLEKMYKSAIKDNLDIVVCNMNKYNDINKKFEIHKVITIPEFIMPNEVFNYKKCPDDIFNYFQNAAWNKLYKLEFIKSNNLKFQEIRRTNDLFFTKRAIVLANRISCLENIFVHYRSEMKTNCQSNNYKYPLEFLKSLIALKKFLSEKNLYKEVEQSYLKLIKRVVRYNQSTLFNYPKEFLYLHLAMMFKYCFILKLPITTLQWKMFFKILMKQLFSIKNSSDKKYKIFIILGLTLKFKKK